MAPLYGSILGLVVASNFGVTATVAYTVVAAAVLFASEWRRG